MCVQCLLGIVPGCSDDKELNSIPAGNDTGMDIMLRVQLDKLFKNENVKFCSYFLHILRINILSVPWKIIFIILHGYMVVNHDKSKLGCENVDKF